MKYNDTVILLFAKAPVKGTVNTRLIPDIGVEEATKLQYDLIHNRLSMLTKISLCTVYLMCAPTVDNECFIQCDKQYPIVLKKQLGSDLGERMLGAVKLSLEKYKYCILIGTDAPALDEVLIEKAIVTMHNTESVVFVPAEDGGYVLLGLQYAHEFLFNKIDWGSDKVMQQSRDKLVQYGISYCELPICWDVDRFEDYQRYIKEIN